MPQPVLCRLCSRFMDASDWPEHAGTHRGQFCGRTAPGVCSLIVCREAAGHTGLWRAVLGLVVWNSAAGGVLVAEPVEEKSA